MDGFLATWKPQEPVSVREFATKYFAWCDSHILPRSKVNTETLRPHGYQVIDGKIFGIPKENVK
jgi:hypothetical protein